MVKLTDVGFSKGVVCETIVSTYNADGSVNAAPMGLKIQDEEHLTLSIFNTSSTCRNLKAKQCAAINLTRNIEVFYKSTFKEATPDGKVPSDWFVKAVVVEAPKLRFAEAVIEVSAVELPSVGVDQTEFCCKVEAYRFIGEVSSGLLPSHAFNGGSHHTRHPRPSIHQQAAETTRGNRTGKYNPALRGCSWACGSKHAVYSGFG